MNASWALWRSWGVRSRVVDRGRVAVLAQQLADRLGVLAGSAVDDRRPLRRVGQPPEQVAALA